MSRKNKKHGGDRAVRGMLAGYVTTRQQQFNRARLDEDGLAAIRRYALATQDQPLAHEPQPARPRRAAARPVTTLAPTP
jgi:hypothetical protein